MSTLVQGLVFKSTRLFPRLFFHREHAVSQHPVLLVLLGPLGSPSIEIWREQNCPALSVLYVLVVTSTRNWIEAW